MKKKYLGIVAIASVVSLCSSSMAFAKVSDDDVTSKLIAEADGVSGQDTNSGLGIKTGHIQDGAVTDAKISDVSMEKVSGLQFELFGEDSSLQNLIGSKASQSYVDWKFTNVDTALADVDTALTDVGIAIENPVLPVNSIEPYTCEATDTGAIALTSKFTTCVCTGSDWVLTADGTTSCEWFTPVTSAGQVWMDRNLGAFQVATSSTDSESYGDLYQWGRGADGHQFRTSATTTTLSSTDDPGHGDFIMVDPNGPLFDWRVPQNDNLWQGASGTNNPCPDGYRIPTDTEWVTERLSWSSLDPTGAIESPLHLPMAGFRGQTNGLLYTLGERGYYWSSTITSAYNADRAVITGINASPPSVNSYAGVVRSVGASVRCIMD